MGNAMKKLLSLTAIVTMIFSLGIFAPSTAKADPRGEGAFAELGFNVFGSASGALGVG